VRAAVAARRRSTALEFGAALIIFVSAGGCARDKSDPAPAASAPARSSSIAPARPSAVPLDLLYLEDAPSLPPPAGGLLPPPRGVALGASPRCPAEMVEVRGEFCIDRFEITLVDAASDRDLSPFYHPTRALTQAAFARYRRDTRANVPLLPQPPAFQLEGDAIPRARAMQGVIPQGYLNAVVAEAACMTAGKRLCSLTEWVTACRGEHNRKFPYGDRYATGQCNVFRDAHPAVLLHRDASRDHLDPRLNLMGDAAGSLLKKTGQTSSCRSVWGADAIYDMVGNVDEWVADGSFVGGFYARATREGCDARISSHAREYFDYSLGTRCCRSLSGFTP
jgi:formylglycine-generating enzyme